MSAKTYIKRAVADVQRTLNDVGQRLKTKVTTPMADKYRPELDASPELNDEQANYFQGLIGILRWIVELGRLDIMVAVALLSRFLVVPREGHLEQAFHIFAYLNCHERSRIVLDGRDPIVDESRFRANVWTQYYPDAVEEIPPNVPLPRGLPVFITVHCDADHAGCRVTRRSHSGILIFIQGAPIIWYSERQNIVESAVFGSEFIALKTAVEQVEALRYKLRMMGVPVDGPANVYSDSESVFKNFAFPESTLKKKHNAICYHKAREAQAAGVIRIAWESTDTNLADMLTKCLAGPRLRVLSLRVLY
jgi:hypothetical protein